MEAQHMIAVLLLEVIALPFVALIAIRIGKRRIAVNARRIEQYRASPWSHLLDLNN
jgi:hypothetical protein